jgi:UDP-glucose 4-epimerase
VKALVTGAAGFIGQRLVERLLVEDHHVVALVHHEPGPFSSRKHVEQVVGDICDEKLTSTLADGCDTVFHLAGRVHAMSDTSDDAALYESNNLEGTRNIISGAVAAGVSRFVFFSSVKTMGEGGDACLDESFDEQPATAYGRTKLDAERLVFGSGKETGMHVVCLRLPLVYGPGNKGNLYRMIAAIDRGFFPPLPRIENRRSMTHVANVIDAAMTVAVDPRANGRCYIVTDCDAYSTNQLHALIAVALGKRVPKWHVSKSLLEALGLAGDLAGKLTGRRFFFDSDALDKLIGSAWYSSAKITSELGYQPAIKFQDSLPELIAWYKKSRT